MAVLYLPAIVLYALVQVFVVDPAMIPWQNEYLAALQRGDVNELPLPPAVVLLSLVGTLVVGLFGVLATGAVVHVADASYRGGSATAGQAVRAALARATSLIGAFFLLFAGVLVVALVGVVGTVMLVLLGAAIGGPALGVFAGLIGAVGTVVAVMFVALRWAMSIQAVMCESAGAAAAMGRSWRLIHGSTWRVLGYTLLFTLILVLIGVAVGVVVLLVFRPTLDIAPSPTFTPVTMSPGMTLAETLFSGLAALVFTPWWLTVLTLLYYDLRWQRRELQPAAAVENPAPIG